MIVLPKLLGGNACLIALQCRRDNYFAIFSNQTLQLFQGKRGKMKCQAIYPVGKPSNGGNAIGITIGIFTWLFNVMSNSILIYTLVKLKLMGKATFIFYFFMALSDLLIASFLQPIVVYIQTVSKQTCTITEVVG